MQKQRLMTGVAVALIAAYGCSSASQDRAEEGGAPPATPGSEIHGDPAQAGSVESRPATAAAAASATSPARTEPADDERAYEAVVARARAALAAAGHSGAEQAKVATVVPAQWNDSSLGCPQPGMSYMQVITSGHIVRFALSGQMREVHVAGDAAVVCNQAVTGSPKRANAPVRVETLNKAMTQAREDLATRLGLPLEQITLAGSLPFTWEDGTFRCGVGEDARARVSGYKLQLTAGGQSYVYHTDFRSTFPCPPIANE